jgi:hypothetical protein
MSRPVAQPIRHAGRVLLWVVLAFLLARGALDIVSPTAPTAGTRLPAQARPAFPDDQARAHAIGFARAYLTLDPGRPDARADALSRFLASGLDRQAGVALDPEGRTQRVLQATVARIDRLRPSLALVTVAAELDRPDGQTVYLQVPIQRDRFGRMAVADLPAFAPGPARSTDPLDNPSEPVRSDQRDAVERLVSRFFPAYLAKEQGDLAYFAPPGTLLRGVSGHWADVQLVEVLEEKRPSGRTLSIVATVRARDTATGALHLLRYRLRLEREGRWYVAAVNARPKGAR